MNAEGQKMVDFSKCKTCKYEELKEDESPCDECLSYPMMTYSERPCKYEEKDS